MTKQLAAFNPHVRAPAGVDSKGHPLCRCCGKPVLSFDNHAIHTKCIPKHWGKHAHGVNCSRCVEFSYKTKPPSRIKIRKGSGMKGPFGEEYSGKRGW